MNRRSSLIAATICTGMLLLNACTDDTNGPTPFRASQSATRTASKAGEDVGTARRRAQGTHCCYEGRYSSCKNEKACFGGVDLEACLAKCGDDTHCITNTCTSELRHAPPPKGCSEEEAPAEFPCD